MLLSRKITIAIAILLPAIGILLYVTDLYYLRDNIAGFLKIDRPPDSLVIVDCSYLSPPTDILLTCSMQIKTEEFPLLLKGYQFEASSHDGMSHKIGRVKVGPNFQVVTKHIAHPQEFNGGHIILFSNESRTKILFDLYIE